MVIKLEHTSGKIKGVFFVRIQFRVVKFVFNSLCVHFTTHEDILVEKEEAMPGLEIRAGHQSLTVHN